MSNCDNCKYLLFDFTSILKCFPKFYKCPCCTFLSTSSHELLFYYHHNYNLALCVLLNLKFLQVYFDFMRSFHTEFNDLFAEGLVSAIELGLGASGELKYPSFSERVGWRYPGIGEFQVSIKDYHFIIF